MAMAIRQVTFYRLQPISRFFRVGDPFGGEGVREFIPSDTLFAAMVARIAERGGPDAARAFVRPFAEPGPEGPPFLLTGVFPALAPADGPTLRFFPRPESWGLRAEPEAWPRLRRLRWLSEGLFRLALENRTPGEGDLHRLHEGHAGMRKDEWTALPKGLRRRLPEERPLWEVERRPAVAVDRYGRRSAFYRISAVRFPTDLPVAGWMAIAWSAGADEIAWAGRTWREWAEEVLSELGESGLGGLRSRGGGAFRVERDPQGALPVGSGPAVVSLARYLPTWEELQAGALEGDPAAYALVEVGGWMRAPGFGPDRPRRTAVLLEAGAVIRAGGRLPLGRMIDIRPPGAPHPSWRYGLAFPIPLNAAAWEA
jgi:CRISPR type III-A-associated RAMP protein Csm4